MSDFVLNGEDVVQVTIVAVGPHVSAVFSMDELSGDPYPGPRLPNASFQNKVDPKVFSHLRRLHRLALISEHGVTRHDEQARYLREVRNDILGYAVTKI